MEQRIEPEFQTRAVNKLARPEVFNTQCVTNPTQFHQYMSRGCIALTFPIRRGDTFL